MKSNTRVLSLAVASAMAAQALRGITPMNFAQHVERVLGRSDRVGPKSGQLYPHSSDRQRQRRYGQGFGLCGARAIAFAVARRSDPDITVKEFRMATLATKIKQVTARIDTKDVTARENEFLQFVHDHTEDGKYPERLSPKQAQWVEDIHRQHYG
jgi:hypothetical protein